MTDTCRNCRFRSLCEESGYELDYDGDVYECDHYSDYLEGIEYSWLME